jgi:hypothetical protein
MTKRETEGMAVNHAESKDTDKRGLTHHTPNTILLRMHLPVCHADMKTKEKLQ